MDLGQLDLGQYVGHEKWEIHTAKASNSLGVI